MAATDSRRLADLDVDELDRLLPLIKVTPFAAHRTSAPRGCGCPCAAPRRMEESQASSERTPNPPHNRSVAFGQFQERLRESFTHIKMAMKIINYSEDCMRKIVELNATLPLDQHFFPACIWPRDLEDLRFSKIGFYVDYRLNDTSPTTWGCKRFAHEDKYVASTMLRINGLVFTGDFPHGRSMHVYGFVAVRDDKEPLRNYIFNVSREKACQLNLDSPSLEISPPMRGISVWDSALIEFHLKVKGSDSDSSSDDDILINACMEFDYETIEHDKKLISRIDGPFGPLDMRYIFLKNGIEATIDIDLGSTSEAYDILLVAFSGEDSMTLYKDRVGQHTKFTAVVIVPLDELLHIKAFGTYGSSHFDGNIAVPVLKHGSCKKPFWFQLAEKKSGHKNLPRACLEVTFSTMGYYNTGEM
ncbi:uncharacterized protein [Oryza sativa Japonica Group]|uniref:uncharacterized protein isoform X2 n=1 Tax=Oryza sativa subsp. japonica TaxID=39947 RepID=UPI0027ABA237|nr:hypothetical protein DAI22_05g191900 [Oryza sativa Japonica Group]